MSQIADNSGALSLAEVADLYIESLHEDLEGRAYHSDSAPKNNVTAEVQPPRVGDLWLTYGTSENPPVLIAISWVGDRFCRAVFVLEEPELAAEDDLLVSAEQCSLGAPLALCAWRDLPVSKGDLRQLVGVLPDDIIEPLGRELLESTLWSQIILTQIIFHSFSSRTICRIYLRTTISSVKIANRRH